MDRSALLSECHSKLASKSAADVQAAVSLLDSEDLKEDSSVSLAFSSVCACYFLTESYSHRLERTFHPF